MGSSPPRRPRLERSTDAPARPTNGPTIPPARTSHRPWSAPSDSRSSVAWRAVLASRVTSPCWPPASLGGARGPPSDVRPRPMPSVHPLRGVGPVWAIGGLVGDPILWIITGIAGVLTITATLAWRTADDRTRPHGDDLSSLEDRPINEGSLDEEGKQGLSLSYPPIPPMRASGPEAPPIEAVREGNGHAPTFPGDEG